MSFLVLDCARPLCCRPVHATRWRPIARVVLGCLVLEVVVAWALFA
jgi:hypothetical protein